MKRVRVLDVTKEAIAARDQDKARVDGFVDLLDGQAVGTGWLDVNVAREGEDELEAIANLREALELYFEDAAEQDMPPVTHAHVDSFTLKSA